MLCLFNTSKENLKLKRKKTLKRSLNTCGMEINLFFQTNKCLKMNVERHSIHVFTCLEFTPFYSFEIDQKGKNKEKEEEFSFICSDLI